MKNAKWLVPVAAAGTAVGAIFGLQFAQAPPRTQAPMNATAGYSMRPFSEVADLLLTRSQMVLGTEVARNARTVPLDDSWRPVPESAVDSATSAYVEFTTGPSRQWRVFVGPADGRAPDSCPSVHAEGVLSCDASTDPNTGDVVITLVTMAVKAPDLDGQYYVLSSDTRSVSGAGMSGVRIERDVRAFHRSGYMTSARETVYGPANIDPSQVFETPVEALRTIATDPELDASDSSAR